MTSDTIDNRIDMERAAKIEGLRQLADFLEAHPSIPVAFQTFKVYFDNRDELAAAARIGSWEKIYRDTFFILRRTFGSVRLEVFTDREKVCKAVVVGTRQIAAVAAVPAHIENVIQWECETESLLDERAE